MIQKLQHKCQNKPERTGILPMSLRSRHVATAKNNVLDNVLLIKFPRSRKSSHIVRILAEQGSHKIMFHVYSDIPLVVRVSRADPDVPRTCNFAPEASFLSVSREDSRQNSGQ